MKHFIRYFSQEKEEKKQHEWIKLFLSFYAVNCNTSQTSQLLDILHIFLFFSLMMNFERDGN
jgi:hypothetical protein